MASPVQSRGDAGVQAETVEAEKREVLEAYLEDLETQGLTPRTIQNYRSNVQIFLDHIGDTSPLAVGKTELRSFLRYLREEREISPKAIERYFSALNSFYQFLEFEEEITRSPVPAFRKRYLKTVRRDADNDREVKRQLLSVEEMRTLVHSVMDARDRAIITLLAKTGVRRNELIQMDLEDIDWEELSIELKPTRKRTNRIVYFDDETSRVLRRWLAIRTARGGGLDGPLFTTNRNTRVNRNAVYNAVTEAAQAVGLHKPGGKLREKFTPHCCRHWFTTHLRRAGMTREHIAELRGDTPTETLDIYMHIDRKALRESYRACIPQLGL